MAGTAFGPMQGRCLPYNYNVLFLRYIIALAKILQSSFSLVPMAQYTPTAHAPVCTQKLGTSYIPRKIFSKLSI